MNSISDEFSRLQSTFAALINQLNQSDNIQRGVDEEANTSNQQMPGAFVFSDPNNSSTTETNNRTSLMSNVISVLITTVLLLLILPLYVIYKVVIHSLFIVTSIFLKFQKLKYKPLRSNDPVDVSRRFIRAFDERIGNKNKTIIGETGYTDSSVIEESDQTEIQRPDFLECAYSHAMLIVKKDVRWLLCYIESTENPDSMKFTNDVLINTKFLNFIKKRKILIWGGDISESEAYITCNQFKIAKLPFLGLLCMTVNQIPTSAGMQQSSPVLSLVSKIQGYKDLEFVLKKLDKAYRKYNPTVIRLQNLSPQSDRMTVITQERREQTSNLNGNHTRSEEAHLSADELENQWRKWRKSKLLPACETLGDYATIAVRLPNGTRNVQKINKICSLEEIYATVECIMLNEVNIEEGVQYERPLGYHHEYKFDIYTVFPREYIPCDSGKVIEETAVIFPSGNLIVELS